MNKPSTRTMILGHPIISVPFMLAGAATVGAGLYDSKFPAVIAGALILGMAADASQKVKAYRAWAREWDAMAPGSAPAAKRPWVTIIIVALGLAWWGLDCFGGRDPGTAALGISVVVMGTLGGLALLKAFFRHARRPARPAAKSAVVTVIARPPVFIPSLQDAYRALPPYCHALLVNQ